MSRQEFCRLVSVSCETLERLDTYVGLLVKWSRAIGLIGPTNIDEIWHRHLLDCAQLINHVPEGAKSWLDLGSGAGLPGLVCAIILKERAPQLHFELVDGDQRKAAFLREASRQTGLNLTVHAARSEEIPAKPYDVISARALAPLSRLLRIAAPFVAEQTIMLFHKGQAASTELTDARQHWHIEADMLPSLSDSTGTILRISRLRSLT